MKMLKLRKDNGRNVWLQLDQIVSVQDAGRDLIITCADNIGYRVECPDEDKEPKKVIEFKKIKAFFEDSVVFESSAIIE